MKKKLVYICSPCKGHDGNREHNIIMAQEYCRQTMTLFPDVIPLAPHVYFTQFFDDSDMAERKLCMDAGIDLMLRCQEVWVFGIKNPSEGMKKEIELARKVGIPVVDACDIFGTKQTAAPAADAVAQYADNLATAATPLNYGA